MAGTVGIIINLLLIAATLFVIFVLLLPVVLGAPYLPTEQKKLAVLVNLAKIKPGERAVDLGSGDGRIVMALARAGAEAHGYEINLLLVWLSRRNIKRAGLSKRAFIHWKSFRLADFSKFQVVTMYALKSIMKELESRLQKELPAGGRVLSHVFRFPNWAPATAEQSIYLYKKDAIL